MLRRYDWRLASLYICTIGLFLIVSIVNYISFKEIRANADQLTAQTYPTDHTVNQLLLAVVNQETAIRAYMLTSDTAYLEPYEQGKQEVGTIKLSLLEPSNRVYETEIENIFASLAQVELYFAHVRQLIESNTPFDLSSLLKEGKQSMDQFREQLRVLQLKVNSSMEKSWSDQHSRANTSMEMIVIGAILSVIVIIATWYLFRTAKNLLRITFESERRYRRLVDHSPDAIAVHQDGIIVFANPACAQLVGASDPAQIIGKPLMQFVPQPYTEVVAARADQAMQEKDVGILDEQFVRFDGSLIDVEVTAIGYPFEGRPAVQIMAREVGFRKEAERKMKEANELLHRLSTLDGLTGIPNRRSFDQDFRRFGEQSEQNDASLSIILFDVDNFKAYNDYYGHQDGDACLQMVARTAEEQAVAAGGVAYRYGGEEFALLLPNQPMETAIEIAEKIRLAIERSHIPHEGISPDAMVTISVGLATWDRTIHSSRQLLLQAADQALYRSKNQGRNIISIAPARTES